MITSNLPFKKQKAKAFAFALSKLAINQGHLTSSFNASVLNWFPNIFTK